MVGVGYEGLDVEGFVSRLSDLGVQVLADVRLTPISRKKGFSKRALAEALSSAGVEYLHLRELGNPKDNRPGFAGDSAALSQARGRYAELLDVEAADGALDRLTVLARQRRVAVMCFEADEERCHRHVVLQAVRARLDLVSV
ncbi:DUF488 domain-containing protein [Saccharothrix xinjiangensis]|uniref:DUF488 domain-containing protein n=1 Tax=Saccharothrix xinjiangensis TaxID=204798 RepID=A0ABV9XYD1_9PSEU